MANDDACHLIIIITSYNNRVSLSLFPLQWSIRFDDSLTSTFEYVSETSFLEAYDDDVDSSSDSQMSGMHTTGQKFMTISEYIILVIYSEMRGCTGGVQLKV